jgi:2-C-methyl-D-erythritol 2,4-cyclodiphosphate synthase
MRVGMGYDIHRLVKGKKLILGGISVPFNSGLLGYSDADVLIHAIIDSLLGAVSAGDIGKHFPVGDSAYKNISSVVLLKKIAALLKKKKVSIKNVDSIVVAEKPRQSGYTTLMEKKIASSLGISKTRVCVKAKTAEGLGDVGRGKAIEAYAVCLAGVKN